MVAIIKKMKKALGHFLVLMIISAIGTLIRFPFLSLGYVVFIVFLSIKNKGFISILEIPKAINNISEASKKEVVKKSDSPVEFSATLDNVSGNFTLIWKNIDRHFLNIKG